MGAVNTEKRQLENTQYNSEVARFYFDDNGQGQQHHEFMAEPRMLTIFRNCAANMDARSETRTKINEWCKAKGLHL